MIGGRYASITPNNQIVFYTLDPDLQMFVEKLVREARSPHLAIVAINPKTGAILAMKGKSETIPDPALHSGFPAASLFKVVTAAAAVEEAGIRPDSLVAFRGGTYTLNEYNYLPDPRRDRRVMSVGEAMGRSCNPVFGHLSTKYLDGSILARYASRFGFNRNLKFDAPLPSSSADIPDQDLFELSRTGAGFRGATISPVHAAALVAGLRDGQLRRPYTIDSVVTIDGVTMSKTRPEILQPIVEPSTAKTLLEMMRYTTTVGTSRREFMRGARPTLRELDVGAKTGTLKGTNPSGLTLWFMAAAPIQDPELALAIVTVNGGPKPSYLGRLVFQKYFNIEPVPELRQATPGRRYTSSKSKRYSKPKYYAKKPAKSTKTTKAKSSSKRRS
jgi:cell division protein FtsI/penicillin-binding protein 2